MSEDAKRVLEYLGLKVLIEPIKEPSPLGLVKAGTVAEVFSEVCILLGISKTEEDKILKDVAKQIGKAAAEGKLDF